MDDAGFWRKRGNDLRFIFTVRVTAGQSFTLPTVSNGSYDAKIEWGDGQEDDLTVWNAPEITHTYVNAGDYDIAISGVFTGWSVNNYADRLKIVEVKQWGCLLLGTGNGAFHGCGNLSITATDLLDTSGCNSFADMFRNCSSITTIPNIGSWDLTNVTSIQRMFAFATSFTGAGLGQWDTSGISTFYTNVSGSTYGVFHNCSAFNEDISGWDFSSTASIQSLLQGCTSFNQDISGWDVTGISNISNLFRGCASFNQDLSSWSFTNLVNISGTFYGATSLAFDISGWDVSNVTSMNLTFRNTTHNWNVAGWDVSSCTSFQGTFRGNPNFNQPIGSWEMSQAQSLGGTSATRDGMLQDCTAFDQDLSAWNVENVVRAYYFLHGGNLSTVNYDALLVSWGGQSLNALSFSTVHFGSSQYTSGGAAEAGRSAMISMGWHVVDGGPA